MKSEIRTDALHGRVLFLANESCELGVALDFGVRIVHFSAPGMPNLLYAQPADLSDGLSTEGGWRIHGGHRFWSAPESEMSYYPDNDPVAYTLFENGVLVTQNVDPWMQEQKSLRISFEPDGSVKVDHILKNCSDVIVKKSAWGVSTTAAGGTVELPFPGTGEGDYNPKRVMSFWGNTSLADPRLKAEKDKLVASHIPCSDYFKLGVYSSVGRVTRYNLGQRFDIEIEPKPLEKCPDGGVNIELYINPYILEMETLGVTEQILPGGEICHSETWHVEKS